MRTELVVAALVAGISATSQPAAPQDSAKPSLSKKLEAEYVLTTMTSKNDVVTPGSLLVIRKGGLTAGPATWLTSYQNVYKDGHIKHGLSNLVMNRTEVRDFDIGEKVYLLKLDLKDNSLVFHIVSGEVDDGVRYKASVAFQFPKGYRPEADISDVQLTIDELFGVESGGAPGAEPPGMTQSAGSAPNPDPPVPPSPGATQTQVAVMTIEAGQSTEQVIAALGQPQRILKLGAKEIYSYKDLKIAFVNRKVTDVE